MKEVYIVLYKEVIYLVYKINHAGNCQMIDQNGKKYIGTPSPKSCKLLYKLPTKKYNGTSYAKTKVGVVSCATGRIIKSSDIIKMFE